jgi:hypothetical protein
MSGEPETGRSRDVGRRIGKFDNEALIHDIALQHKTDTA